MVLIDSHPEAKRNEYTYLQAIHPSETTFISAVAQCFTVLSNRTFKLTSVKFSLRRARGSPVGHLQARLYTMKGTYGTNGYPSELLAQSDLIAMESIGDTFTVFEFTFPSGQQYEMQAGQHYCIGIIVKDATTIGEWDCVVVGMSGLASATHSGNSSAYFSGAIHTYSGNDMVFYVYGDPVEVPPLGKGRLNVYATVDGEPVTASFLINNQGPYDTPYRLDLDPATYTLIGSYEGQTDKKTVEIGAGETKRVILAFTKIHKLTIVSTPSPINFTFNTEAQSTPFVRELVGDTYTIVMPKSWMIGLDEYLFEQWENGSRRPTRTVTLASPQEVTVTATYRLRQIDEAGPINQRQMKDTLQEVVGQGADLSPTNPLPTEDSGVHSNPEKFVQDHKFSSWPIDRAGAVATLLYGIASPAAHRRTAGLDITVWWIYFYNHSGGAATVWLESPAGTVISATIQLADNQGVMLNVKPLDVGDEEIFVNASANDVQCQIGGIET